MTHGREQPRVGRVRALVLQYPTTTFFLLTFLITWAVWVPNVLAPDSFAGILALFGTYGPAAAAVIVAAIVGLVAPFPLLDGRQGCLRELFVIMLVELPAMSVLYTWVFSAHRRQRAARDSLSRLVEPVLSRRGPRGYSAFRTGHPAADVGAGRGRGGLLAAPGAHSLHWDRSEAGAL
jgi:hypothetical protein